MQFEIIDQIQGSDQWKSWRKGKITASMAPTIMGENPYETPLQLYERLQKGEEIEDNHHMARGRLMEPLARDLINKDSGRVYKPICVQSKKYPWLAASLDGYDELSPQPILEIKNPAKPQDPFIGVPDQYYAQLQAQMIVVGSDESLYMEFYGEEYKTCVVKKNEEYCEILIKKLKDFDDGLNNYKAPEPVDKDFVEVSDPDATIFARAYQSVTTKIKELEKEQEDLKKRLIESTNHPRTKIAGLKIQMIRRFGSIDYKNIPEFKALNLSKEYLDKYRKPPIETWRIT